MSTIKHVIIAAAGMGTRLGQGLPKALVRINGKAIIDYQLEMLKDVPDIRIVVGYMEEKLIKHVKAIRPDVIFVRNPDFKNTTTLQSVFLGTRGIKEKCLIVDGDMIITQKSFDAFCEICSENEELVAISKDITDNPVYVSVNDIEGVQVINSFSRDVVSTYEWSNMAFLDPGRLNYLPTHVYQCIEKFCPIRGLEIERVEVDTDEDFNNANLVVTNNINY